MNYEALKFWLAVIQFAATMGIGIYVWWSNREKVTNRRFSSLESQVKEMVSKPELSKVKEKRDLQISEIKKVTDNISGSCLCHPDMLKRMDGHNDRLGQHKELIVKIEAEFNSLPKKRDLETVYERVNTVNSQIADLRGEVGKISGILPGLTHITEMMNDFLLRQGGK